ncbi:hypothetical protein M9194_19650 [Vibrio sp. S4M6]|uniref:hypothetical protein n=1 Tax=Vibrio sinus TaxID=2946865 RepID=UPI00202A9E22|nr:hypothetical protein [Vibrio sinus]MCL9783643.1 hypothetical protein [Vibrio sinus]
MFPSDASELQAYVMQNNGMTQEQAQSWLDKWVPHWRTEEPNEPVGFYECENGEE